LFVWDFNGQKTEQVESLISDNFANFAPNFDDGGFVKDLVMGVIEKVEELDALIRRHATEWPLDQIAAIDRNILRIAFWEFAVSRETPVKVAINEAVELAKLYGSDSAPRFVNGVLGTLVEHENEIHQIIKNRIALDAKLES